MSEQLGYVGAGAMGSRMIENLLGAGYEVVVFDVDPDRVDASIEAGATSAESPRAVAEAADVVFSSLPSSDIIELAYLGDDGLVHGVSEDSLLVEMSTNNPSVTESVAAEIDEAGATMIDAPVIGTPPVAARAEMTIMVGGPDEAFERAEPILQHLGEPVYHVGRVGDGHRTKLLNNMVLLGNYAIAAEALSLAKSQGIDQELMYDVLDSGVARSDIVEMKASKAFAEDFDPGDGMAIDKARKDLTYAQDMGYHTGFTMPITAAIEEHYTLASTVGRGGDDYSVLLRVLDDLFAQRDA
ncbi:MAG: NAD(P)-dependent oxidoreductase [Halobacteriota archaeon]